MQKKKDIRTILSKFVNDQITHNVQKMSDVRLLLLYIIRRESIHHQHQTLQTSNKKKHNFKKKNQYTLFLNTYL